jgi:signal transduction histidine kinase
MFSVRLSNISHSTTFRLGIRFMMLFTISFLIIGTLIYWQTGRLMEREYRGQIDGEVTEMQYFYDRFGPDRVAAEIIEREQQDPFWISFLLDNQCNPIAGNSRWMNRAEQRGGAERASGGLRSLCRETEEEGWLRFEIRTEVFPPGSSGSAYDDDIYGRLVSLSDEHQIIVGRMAGNLEDLRNIIFDSLLWGLMVTLGLAIIVSLSMSRSVNNRLEIINRVSRQIRQGDLSRRIPSIRPGDEFDRLGGNLNEMLDQIEHLMAGVRDVSNAIAHDLRTPLTRLRNHLEQVRDDAVNDEMRHKIEDTIIEADALLATFSSLLRIAQIEAGNRRREFGEIELNKLIDDVIELYEPLATEKNIGLTVNTSTLVRASGDRDLLFQAISNLLDNAIKYTPSDGNVNIRLVTGPTGPRVEIGDSGEGIPEVDRERVFERFYRRETHRGSPGSGLGLSLVAAVVTLHGGLLTLADRHPGLHVQIDLPKI